MAVLNCRQLLIVSYLKMTSSRLCCLIIHRSSLEYMISQISRMKLIFELNLQQVNDPVKVVIGSSIGKQSSGKTQPQWKRSIDVTREVWSVRNNYRVAYICTVNVFLVGPERVGSQGWRNTPIPQHCNNTNVEKLHAAGEKQSKFVVGSLYCC